MTREVRWNATCILVEKRYEPDREGVMQAEDVKTPAFCNEYSVGAHTWSSMYEIGISPDAQLQLRTCDYHGERDVVYQGKWYSVEVVKAEGDFVRLTLRRQQSDSADGEGAGGE